MTGDAARRHLAEESRRLREVAGLLKTPVEETASRLAALLEDKRKLERELQEARRKLAMGGGAGGGDPIRDVAGVKLMARSVSGVEMKDLKSLADEGKKRLGSGIVAIVGVAEDGKAGIVVGVTEDLTEKFDAVALVRVGSEKLGGKGGGGRRDMAQAGGPDGAQAEAALAAIEAAMAAA
jgi:alanyl-tRNA synthetase